MKSLTNDIKQVVKSSHYIHPGKVNDNVNMNKQWSNNKMITKIRVSFKEEIIIMRLKIIISKTGTIVIIVRTIIKVGLKTVVMTRMSIPLRIMAR